MVSSRGSKCGEWSFGGKLGIMCQMSRPLAPHRAAVCARVVARARALRRLVAVGRADLRAQLWQNAAYFRTEMAALGYRLLPGEHAIIPVMLGDPKLAQQLAAGLHDEGVYVTAFSFPVVPKGTDRIRTQMNAALTRADLDDALAAFAQAGRDTGVLT